VGPDRKRNEPHHIRVNTTKLSEGREGAKGTQRGKQGEDIPRRERGSHGKETAEPSYVEGRSPVGQRKEKKDEMKTGKSTSTRSGKGTGKSGKRDNAVDRLSR